MWNLLREKYHKDNDFYKRQRQILRKLDQELATKDDYLRAFYLVFEDLEKQAEDQDKEVLFAFCNDVRKLTQNS
jgi:hypothetical protein